MFTSEPSLPQRIERLINDVPILDTRSDLDPSALGAPDLAHLLGEPPVQRALMSVGMPIHTSEPDSSVEERVNQCLPFLQQVRQTSTVWSLFRIFRDLYDFDEPQLTPENYPTLMDRVAQKALDTDWAERILRDRARLATVVTPAPLEDRTVEPVATGGLLLVHRLEVVAGHDHQGTPQEIRSQLFNELDHSLDDQVRFVALTVPINLEDPLHAALLEWHHLHEWPIQILLDQGLGSRGNLAQVEAAAVRYPRARLSLMTGHAELGALVAEMAGQRPNIFAEGFAAAGAGSTTLERNVLARVEQAGVSRIGGFASGARSAEWVYGSLQATKRATALALARVVSGGFLDEDEIPALVKKLFHDSPSDWYRLDK